LWKRRDTDEEIRRPIGLCKLKMKNPPVSTRKTQKEFCH
jgi:hypothetical protein